VFEPTVSTIPTVPTVTPKKAVMAIIVFGH